jgi:hypothetical protein
MSPKLAVAKVTGCHLIPVICRRETLAETILRNRER